LALSSASCCLCFKHKGTGLEPLFKARRHRPCDMGQCVGGSATTPSAFELCRAFEQQSRGSSGHSNVSDLSGDGNVSSIWQLAARYEIRALGQIVSDWARRQIDGRTACWQLWHFLLQEHPIDSHARPEFFSMIEAVFQCRVFEEAHVTAMRDLGLEGSRALPDEVHASFRRKAKAILECLTKQQQQHHHHRNQNQHQHQHHQQHQHQQHQQQQQQQQLHRPADLYPDFVQLCLCVEVVRHLQASCTGQPGRGVLLAPRAASSSVLVDITQGMPASMISIMGINGAGETPGTYSSGTIAMGGNEKHGQLKGLTPEEIDQHCPKVHRCAADGGRCPVCLAPSVPGEVVRLLPCKHALNQECCEAWLATADSCPICRFRITSD